MRLLLALLALCLLTTPVALCAEAGPYWGADSEADSILKRREARREARAKELFDTPPRLHQVRIGWSIISQPDSPRRRRNIHPALITGVVDGSIVSVNLPEGTNTEVRLLGVDAPETGTATGGGECFANEARALLRENFAGTAVVLERDKRYQRDSYRRLVRYVRTGSQDIGAWMIWNGFAFADRDHPHLRSLEYLEMETDAMKHERGLWGHACDYNEHLETLQELE